MAGEVVQLLIAVAVVLGAAHLLGGFARRLGQPAVVGEIAAGFVLGPSLLGALAPGVAHALVPAEVRPGLDRLAQAGLVVFVFCLGAELSAASLRRHSRTIVAVSIANVVVPLAIGFCAALALATALRAPSTVSVVDFALFVGLSLAVTALPVLARILDDAGLANHALGQTALACAALIDAVVWCLFVALAAVAPAGDAGEAALRLALVTAFVAAALVAVRPLASRVAFAAPPGVCMLCGLALAFGFALTTESLGVHAIAGGVLAGVAAYRLWPRESRLSRAIVRVNRLALLPVFFASVGLGVDLASAAIDASLLVVAGIVLAIAVGAKVLPTAAAARVSGMESRDSIGLGVLLSAKGLTELVVLKAGLDLGLIGIEAFTVLVAVALATTAMAMPGLQLLRLVRAPAPSQAARLRESWLASRIGAAGARSGVGS